MRPRLLTLLVVIVFVGACSSSSSPAPSAGGSVAPASVAPAGSAAASASPAASAAAGGDLSSITGTASCPAGSRPSRERGAHADTVSAFQAAYPNVKVDYQAIAGDYPTVDGHQLRRAQRPGPLLRQRRATRPSGSTRASSSRSTTTSPSRASTPASSSRATSPLQGHGRQDLRPPQGRQHDRDGLQHGRGHDRRPKTLDELVTAATALKGKDGLKAPMCLNPGLDRGLPSSTPRAARSSPTTATTAAIDTDASKAAVQWYLDLFKNGLGHDRQRPGRRLVRRGARQEHVAITFEGGWLDPAHDQHLSRHQVRVGRVPDRLAPASPVTISLHRQLLDRRRLQEQGPGARCCCST